MTMPSQRSPQPTDLGALIALAQREHHAGRLAEAAAAYRQILALQPNLAEAYNNLGNVLLVQGQLDEARVQYERATALKPELFQAHNRLGDVFHRQGKLDQAVTRYRRAIALRPDLAETHNNLAAVLGRQGNLDAAAAHCQRAVALNPSMFEAHNNLGNIFRRQGKLDQAVAHYRQAIALAPNFADAHYNLGGVLNQQGQLDEAAAQYERALALNPNLFQAHNNLATVLRKQGKIEQAVAESERAVALQPAAADMHKTLANTLRQQGDFERALAAYQQALALSPDHADAHFNRAILKKFRADDPDLAALEALAAQPDRLSAREMIYVHFALGKALEDVGDYPRAFEQFLLGNGLKRREVEFSSAAAEQMFRLIAHTFDAGLLDRQAAAGDPSPVPIFVLGMPRSGSTLVEQILASHPQVQAAGEMNNLSRAVEFSPGPDGRPIPFPAYASGLTADSLRRMGQAYVASLPPLDEGKTRLTDKMPGNYVYIGLIHLILPHARIIHTMRDPLDTCVSCFSGFFASMPFSYDLAELGRYYRGYHDLMAHWRAVLPAGAMLDVVYENVVDNLEEQARRLIDFCGLAWDDRCLSFHETSRPVATASTVQVRQPLYRSSLGRWRRYEAFLGPLLAELEGCRQ
jgi:tetratricopeptide (TPR) repeat protein